MPIIGYIQKTTYSSERSINTHGAYKCSKCGKIVYFEHDFNIVSSKTSYGILSDSKETEEIYKEYVSHDTQKKLVGKINFIKNAIKEKNFRILKFKGFCNHCGNYEPWQKLDYSNSDRILFKIILPVSLLVIFLLILLKMWPIALVLLSAIILTFLSYEIIKIRKTKQYGKEIQALDDMSLPTLFWNEDQKYAYMKKNDPETLETFISQKTTEDDFLFCSVCGASIDKIQSTCHVCGNKINI